MTVFEYSFTCNSIEYILKIVFQDRSVIIFEDPWGRNSSGSPDYVIPFDEVNTSTVLNEKFQSGIPEKMLDEIRFLAAKHQQSERFPDGNRLFFFRTTHRFSKKKEKSAKTAAILFLLVFFGIVLYEVLHYFLVLSANQQQHFGLNNVRITLFSAIAFGVAAIVLLITYRRKVNQPGYAVLGTEEGLYVYEENQQVLYNWKAFTGKYECFEDEQTILLELTTKMQVYNKYGSNKVNNWLHLAGMEQLDFHLKILLHRIEKYKK